MNTNLKFSFEILDWQQFELLAYKCLQIDVSQSLTFIEGGSDKGRDFVFTGKSNFAGYADIEFNYLFQAKHKSNAQNIFVLNNDLKIELEKVFLKNKLNYNFYCLVTNLTLSGNEYDQLINTFNSFIYENELPKTIKFHIYSYRNLEACIDKNEFLKWCFPAILKSPDLKLLLEEVTNKSGNNISKAWISIFEKNKNNFVYTDVFEKSIKKLDEKNILLLSGPSKAGKTFNAEMLLFTLFGYRAFTPYKIDIFDDFDAIYNVNKKQIFLFDDAFGKYNIDLIRADSFNRKLEYVFELIDENHKCVFTSREYIFKAFLDYSDADINKIISPINVDVFELTERDKSSIFLRYFKNSQLDNLYVPSKNFLQTVIVHKNFSPETIRAYFNNCSGFSENGFLKHLESPDEYLEKDFIHLSDDKKLVLISTLLSLKGTTNSISSTYNKICQDVNNQLLISLNALLFQLEGSFLKNTEGEYSFYHPSMVEFFVQYISKDTSIYRRLFLVNFNTKLLEVIQFNPRVNPKYSIKINIDDLQSLNEGFNRIITNPEVTLNELSAIILWITNFDVQYYFKFELKVILNSFEDEIICKILNLDLGNFLHENIQNLSYYFKNIYNIIGRKKINDIHFPQLIDNKRAHKDFWILVFRIIPLMQDDQVFKNINRDWFKVFMNELKKEIFLLGQEVYGSGFPNFEEVVMYEKLMAENKVDAAQLIEKKRKTDYLQKTNREWFKRYSACKEKMNVLKTSQPYGYKIHQKLIPEFSHLHRIEDHEFKRFIFNNEKNWW